MTLNRRLRKKGFSLIELLLAMIFLSLVMLSIMWLNQSSSRSSMDAYYEFMSIQLALEPIEVFRTFGYEWLTTYGQAHSLPDYPVNQWADIKDDSIRHPAESSLFQREITLTPVAGPPKAFRVRVAVAPKNQSRARTWLLRNEVVMEGLIVERPK